jgi:tetratricopeptide (TPR) repeat protein
MPAHVSDTIDWGPKKYGAIYLEASKCRDAGRTKFAEKLTQEALTQFEEAVEYIESAGKREELKGLKSLADWEALALSCYLNVSLCSLKLEQWPCAITSATKALDYDPKNAKALYRRAQATFRGGKGRPADLPAAKADLTAAARREPQNKAVRKELKAVVEMLAKTKGQREKAKKKAREAMESALKDTYGDKRDGQHEMDMHMYTASSLHSEGEFKDAVKSYTAALKEHKLMAQQNGVATHLGDSSRASFWAQVLAGAANGAAQRVGEEEDLTRVKVLTDLVSSLASIRSGIGGTLQRLDMQRDAKAAQDEAEGEVTDDTLAEAAAVAAKLAAVGIVEDDAGPDPTTDAAWQHTESIVLTQLLHEYRMKVKRKHGSGRSAEVSGGEGSADGDVDVDHLCAMASAHGNLGMLLMGRSTKAKNNENKNRLKALNHTKSGLDTLPAAASASEQCASEQVQCASEQFASEQVSMLQCASEQESMLRQAMGHFEDQLKAGEQLEAGAKGQAELEKAADQACIIQGRAHASIGSCMVLMATEAMAEDTTAEDTTAEDTKEAALPATSAEGDDGGAVAGEAEVGAVELVQAGVPSNVPSNVPSIDDALGEHRKGLNCCCRLLMDEGMDEGMQSPGEGGGEGGGEQGVEGAGEEGGVLRVEEVTPPQVKRAALVMAVLRGRMGSACRLLGRYIHAAAHHTTQLRLAEVCGHDAAADAARLGVGWSVWLAHIMSR